METLIHVNRAFIAFNAKYGEPVLPTYIVRKPKQKPIYAHAVDIKGPCTMIDPREEKPLKCGARAYMRTHAEVETAGGMTFQQADRLRQQYAEKLNDNKI